LNNEGLRSENSEWQIGYGIKTRTLSFDVNADYADLDKYLAFKIDGGQNGESIDVGYIEIYVNGEKQVFEEEPVIEEPVVEEPVVEEPVVEEPVIEEPVVEEPVVEAGTLVFTQGSDESYIYDDFEAVNVGDTVIIDMDIIEAKTSNGNLVLTNTGLRSDKSEWIIGNGVKSKHIEFTVTEEFSNSDQYLEFIIADGQAGDYIVIDKLSINFDRVIIEEPVVEEPVVEEPVVEEPVVEEEPVINSFSARNIEFVQGGNNSLRTIDLTAANPGDTVVVQITISSTDRTTSELYLNNVGLRDGLGLWQIGHGIKTKTFDFTINVSDLRDSDKYLEFIIADGQDGESIFVEKVEVSIK
jgi:flagellar basal body L-ring protein FlgH